jgi:hypothetical protein
VGLGFLAFMYFTRWRYSRSEKDRLRINEVYVESDHSSSTNLETISQRSTTEPTI